MTLVDMLCIPLTLHRGWPSHPPAEVGGGARPDTEPADRGDGEDLARGEELLDQRPHLPAVGVSGCGMRVAGCNRDTAETLSSLYKYRVHESVIAGHAVR